MTDAATGTLLWEAVEKRAGEAAFPENTLNPELDLVRAFEAWSERFAARLRTLGVCTS